MYHTGPKNGCGGGVSHRQTDKQTTPIYHNTLVPLHFITWHTFYPHPITPPLSGPHNPARRVTRSHVFHTGAPVSMQPHRKQIRAVNRAFWTSARHKVHQALLLSLSFSLFSVIVFSFSLFFVFVNFCPSLKMTSLMTSSMLELGLGLGLYVPGQTFRLWLSPECVTQTNRQTNKPDLSQYPSTPTSHHKTHFLSPSYHTTVI